MIAEVRTVRVAFGACRCGAVFSSKEWKWTAFVGHGQAAGLRVGGQYTCKCGGTFRGQIDPDNSCLILLRNSPWVC